ncbi:MAG: dephospho-CoA kinase [Bacteroidota bacterium]
MTTLGITGGIGSGKTTVCHIFEKCGTRVFYADDEAKRLMTEHEDVRREVSEAFGPESYLPSGDLNREYLSKRVFGNPHHLRRIGHIVHPRVFESFERQRRIALRDGVGLFIKEAAILFESGGHRHVDATAVVDAPEEERIMRVMRRDQVDAESVRKRMGNQLPPSELIRRADYVIDNSSKRRDLDAQVRRIYDELTSEAKT